MKPLMGQVQNQAHLDDLLGSPKVKEGNFSRSAQKTSSSSSKESNAPSFTDMLLSSISKPQQQSQKNPGQKAFNSKDPTPKIPDEPRRVERPAPKPAMPDKDPRLAAKRDNTPDVIPGPQRDLSRRDLPESSTFNQSLSGATESTPNEAKAALAPLKKQVSGKAGSEGLLNGNAVLAFVAGRLDKLDPDSLPSIVSESALIKQALSSGNVAEFMQTPMSIADLANMMELDQGLLNKAAMNGLDASKLVSIKDFVNALGLDPGKVTAELTMLQQTLPVDGIASYVERAKAMGLKAAGTPNTAESIVPQKPNSDAREPIPGITPASSLPDSISSAIEIPVPLELSGQMSALNVPARVSGNINAANARMPGQNPAGLSQVARQKSGMTEDPADLLMRQARLSGQDIIRQDLQQGAFMASNPVLPTEMANGNNSLSLLNSTKALNLQLQLTDEEKIISDLDAGLTGDLSTESANASKDPFVVVGQMMDNQSKLNIDFGGDGLTQRSLQEHLLANGLEKSSLKKDSIGETIAKTPEETPSYSASNFGIDALTDLRFNTDFTVARENLNAAAQAATIFGGSAFSEGDSREGDASQDFAGQFSDRATDAASAMTSGAQTTHDANGVFADKLSNAPKANTASPIASKILEHAQMMFKNGGGSMSVNVEAPGIGKVDVAINLINNQLDVRIITASDQARDMISKEIAGLRDGLTQQGISLRGLEVGKAGDSSPRHFAGQGQQGFGQGARDQQATYNDMREYVQSFKNTYIPRAGSEAASSVAASTRWANAVKPLLGDKRVEIRV